MKNSKSSKASYVPVVIIVVSFILLAIASGLDYFPLQAKVGFLGKVGLVVGVISFWLFTLMPKWGKKNRK